MRKDEIKVGEVYAASSKSQMSYPRKVKVVENEEYNLVGRRFFRLAKDQLAESKSWVEAHLAFSLTAAFPRDTTPKELDEVSRNLSQAHAQAVQDWFAADPMRQFRKGGSEGILVASVGEDGDSVGELHLVPRRDIRMTWSDWEAKQKAQKAAQEESVRRLAQQRKEEAALRKKIAPALKARLPGKYFPDYSTKVEFTLKELAQLLGVDA